jgi:hypothetical protein
MPLVEALDASAMGRLFLADLMLLTVLAFIYVDLSTHQSPDVVKASDRLFQLTEESIAL